METYDANGNFIEPDPEVSTNPRPLRIDWSDIWHSVNIGDNNTFILFYHNSQNTDGTLDENEFDEIGEGFVKGDCIDFSITNHHCCDEKQIDQTFEAIKRVYRELTKS